MNRRASSRPPSRAINKRLSNSCRLVYDELRTLAAQRMAQERPGQTLQPTGLVHEADLRLVDVKQGQEWNSRGHFFAAAAEAMRRILIENARRKVSQKRGGQRARLDRRSGIVVSNILGRHYDRAVDFLGSLGKE